MGKPIDAIDRLIVEYIHKIMKEQVTFQRNLEIK